MKKEKVLSIFLVGTLVSVVSLGIVKDKSEEYVKSTTLLSSVSDVAYKSNYFVIPHSSMRSLTQGYLQNLSLEQLEIARNEIYARHGYQFQQEKMINYFNNQGWYRRANYTVTTADLSKLEYDNVMLIKAEEQLRYQFQNNNQNYYYGNFIIPDSSYRKVTIDELKYLSSYDLSIARNEIYARHGYIFITNKWKNFFANEYWYTPIAYDVNLNAVEEYNVTKIAQEEARR